MAEQLKNSFTPSLIKKCIKIQQLSVGEKTKNSECVMDSSGMLHSKGAVCGG